MKRLLGYVETIQLILGVSDKKYCRILQGEHSEILFTFIKLPFVIKILSLEAK